MTEYLKCSAGLKEDVNAKKISAKPVLYTLNG